MSNGREIASRIIIEGTLKLTTPAHLGNGDADGLLDMPLSRDGLDDVPLLTGTSIAGALRNYLRTREWGYRKEEQKSGFASLLFGGTKRDDDGEQSPLIVDDAFAQSLPSEIRDGVKIDYKTRLADDKKKYDFELLPTGTAFALRFELLLPQEPREAEKMRAALALALYGLENSEIAIGARRTRGFGRCQVKSWQATTYDLRQVHELVAWLACEHEWNYQSPVPKVGNAATVLGVTPLDLDARHTFHIKARFNLDSSVLIRTTDFLIPPEEILDSNDNNIRQPDFIHLLSPRNGSRQPIISGTTLAGALRSRATRILNTLNIAKTAALIDSLFGSEMENQSKKRVVPSKSRLIVEESVIQAGQMLVQNRVAIDRFTGGAFDTALFSEAPHFGGHVTLDISIYDPEAGEQGLLLLLLKDLWTSDLALGGSSSIGRGRLKGIHATITDSKDGHWEIKQVDQKSKKIHFAKGDMATLNLYMTALSKRLEDK